MYLQRYPNPLWRSLGRNARDPHSSASLLKGRGGPSCHRELDKAEEAAFNCAAGPPFGRWRSILAFYVPSKGRGSESTADLVGT
jgi:hypothetical protein